VVDALDDHASLGVDRLRRMLGERLGEVARILPSAADEAVPPARALPDDRL
jgi:hypothetical protein